MTSSHVKNSGRFETDLSVNTVWLEVVLMALVAKAKSVYLLCADGPYDDACCSVKLQWLLYCGEDEWLNCVEWLSCVSPPYQTCISRLGTRFEIVNLVVATFLPGLDLRIFFCLTSLMMPDTGHAK